MITVHALENSRAHRVLWMLEELGEEYDVATYKRLPSLLAPKELRAIHPLGKSPVISDGELNLAESGAILEYLAETYGGAKMPVPSEKDERLRYRYFLHYAEGSVMPFLWARLVFSRIPKSPMPFFVKPIARAIVKKVHGTYLDPEIFRHLDFIEAELDKHPYFGGANFSAADIQMFYPLEAATTRMAFDTHRWPRINDFIDRMKTRPAFLRAHARSGDTGPAKN